MMDITRRGALATALTAAGALAIPSIARAQGRTMQFWTTQRAPEQIAVYRSTFAKFEAAHPGIKVEVQAMLEEDLLPKLAASLAIGAPPDLISHMPPEFVIQLNEQGLLQPMDDVIAAIGKDDFYPNSLELLFDAKRGYSPGVAIVNSTTTGCLWTRTDLLAEAGLKAPTSWAEMLEAAKKTTKRGVFGTIFAFGKTSMGDKLFLQTLWRTGGTVLAPDGSIAFNGPKTVEALEFMKELLQYSPGQSSSYAYTETINGFVEGRAATAPYSGRVLINVQTQNPKLADKIGMVAYPRAPGAPDVFVGDFQSVVIPKAAADPGLSRALVLALFNKPDYVQMLHTAPSHNLPNLKSVAASPEFLANPVIQRYRGEVDTMIAATAKGRSLLRETADTPLNTKAGAIFGSRILVGTLQDVVIGNMAPKQAATNAADKIAAIMKA